MEARPGVSRVWRRLNGIWSTFLNKLSNRKSGKIMLAAQENRDQDIYFEGEDPSSYWIRFSNLLGIAVIIATVGLYRNSGAVVIAAMLIAPLMTPILGIASAMVMGWTRRMLYLLMVVAGASFGTVALALGLMYLFGAPKGMVVPAEVMARTDPGISELMIALAAGIAGAYVQMRKEEAGLLPGVAIGVSLAPPLAAVGILLYFGEPAHAWEAALLFVTNLAAIVLSACAIFYFLGMRRAMRAEGHITGLGLGAATSLVVVAILAFELSTTTAERLGEARDEERIVVAIKDWSQDYPLEIRHLDIDKVDGKTVVDLGFIVDVPRSFADQIVAPIQTWPADIQRKDLLDALESILGIDTIVITRTEIRYASQWDIKTRQDIGLPEAVTEEDKQG
jgi:uncharacterized hydrophobic protein (TIGR00271 family)